MCLGYNDAWQADKKGNVANIWGIGGYMGGSGDNQMLALGQRLLLVKKTGLANIWGGSKVDGWQRRAGKGTKGRWQGRGQHTSVKSIGKNRQEKEPGL